MTIVSSRCLLFEILRFDKTAVQEDNYLLKQSCKHRLPAEDTYPSIQ